MGQGGDRLQAKSNEKFTVLQGLLGALTLVTWAVTFPAVGKPQVFLLAFLPGCPLPSPLSQMPLESVVRVPRMYGFIPDIQGYTRLRTWNLFSCTWKIQGHFDLEGKLKTLLLTDESGCSVQGHPDLTNPGSICPILGAWLFPQNKWRKVRQVGLSSRALDSFNYKKYKRPSRLSLIQLFTGETNNKTIHYCHCYNGHHSF